MVTIVAVIGGKGGTGKTTIAANLAVGWSRAGRSVVLVDADSQGSISDWAAVAGDAMTIPITGASKPAQLKDLPKLVDSYDIAVIDAGPRISEETGLIIRAADVALLPCMPSGLDIWAQESIADLIRQRQAVADKPKAAIILNSAVSGLRIAGDLLATATEMGIYVLDTTIARRPAIYPSSMSAGRTVYDHQPPSAEAIAEIENLRTEVERFF